MAAVLSIAWLASSMVRPPGTLHHLAHRTYRRALVRAAQSDEPADRCASGYGSVRLDKLLAHATGLSRKDVSRALRKGRVLVNGAPARDSAAKIGLGGETAVTLDGERLELRPPPLLVAYHKPLGVHSTMSDNLGRADLSSALELPALWRSELHPVGRLDADTTGLLLFCSDGTLTQRLLHPRYGTAKEYIALVSGKPLADGGEALRATLAAGVTTTEGTHVAQLLEVNALEGAAAEEALAETLAASDAAGLKPPDEVALPVASLRLSVTEGKHRMVRRMLANAGHPVEALHRVRFGEIALDPAALPAGACAPVGGDALAWAEALREGRTIASPGLTAMQRADARRSSEVDCA
jgi:23S rRNA pseudouridine2605 synthase